MARWRRWRCRRGGCHPPGGVVATAALQERRMSPTWRRGGDVGAAGEADVTHLEAWWRRWRCRKGGCHPPGGVVATAALQERRMSLPARTYRCWGPDTSVAASAEGGEGRRSHKVR